MSQAHASEINDFAHAAAETAGLVEFLVEKSPAAFALIAVLVFLYFLLRNRKNGNGHAKNGSAQWATKADMDSHETQTAQRFASIDARLERMEGKIDAIITGIAPPKPRPARKRAPAKRIKK